MLTGESVPVEKSTMPVSEDVPLGDRTSQSLGRAGHDGAPAVQVDAVHGISSLVCGA